MPELVTLKNGNLTAAINPFGAELTSLALDGREYLWQGDPAWWGRRAPVLFPFVGNIRADRAASAAGPITLGRHGLARAYEHKVVARAEDGTSVTFELADTPETRRDFPYAFRLNMTYALTDEGALAQTFTVTNTGDVDLPFSVGGHPAFNVPAPGGAEAGEGFGDYEFRFARAWSATCPKLVEGGLADPEDRFPFIEGSAVRPLERSCFDFDTVILDHVPESTVTLVGTKSGHGIRVDFPGFDFLGIWSAAPDAPFVALEPWTGHATYTTEDDVFENKDNITLLAPGATYQRTFTVTVF